MRQGNLTTDAADMRHANEIAHRVLPDAGSEWPLTEHGRIIALGHAAAIIQAELQAEYERGKDHGRDDRRMIERQSQSLAREIEALKRCISEIRVAWSWYLSVGGAVSHDDVRSAVTQTMKAIKRSEVR